MEKSCILLFTCLLLFSPKASSQDDVQTLIYKMRIYQKSDDGFRSAYLLEIEDSSLIIVQKKHLMDGTLEQTIVPIKEIEALKFRRKGRVLNGMLIGAAVGLGLGALIGSTSGDDYFTSDGDERILIIGSSMMLNGALIGALLGSSGKKFEINSSQQEFDLIKSELQTYILPIAMDN